MEGARATVCFGMALPVESLGFGREGGDTRFCGPAKASGRMHRGDRHPGRRLQRECASFPRFGLTLPVESHQFRRKGGDIRFAGPAQASWPEAATRGVFFLRAGGVRQRHPCRAK
jgi:hypothetical protein